MPHTINPDELIGKTFLRETSDDGIRLRAKIIERIRLMDNKIPMNQHLFDFVAQLMMGSLRILLHIWMLSIIFKRRIRKITNGNSNPLLDTKALFQNLTQNTRDHNTMFS